MRSICIFYIDNYNLISFPLYYHEAVNKNTNICLIFKNLEVLFLHICMLNLFWIDWLFIDGFLYFTFRPYPDTVPKWKTMFTAILDEWSGYCTSLECGINLIREYLKPYLAKTRFYLKKTHHQNFGRTGKRSLTYYSIDNRLFITNKCVFCRNSEESGYSVGR